MAAAAIDVNFPFAGPSPAFREFMRPLPQLRTERVGLLRATQEFCEFVRTTVLLATGALLLGCGGGGAGSGSPPPPPPPSIIVSVTPQNGTVLLGETLAFTAIVQNSSETAVTWSVNSMAGGSAQVGTITADGVYTAPADLPQDGTVQVTATSHADSSKSGSAAVTLHSDIAVGISPGTANVELGSTQPFHATVNSSGHPDTTIRWSLSGASCPAACGSIDSNGNYTAPQILPSPTLVTISGTSAADSTKQNSASVTVTSNFTLQLSAPPSVPTSATVAIVATLTALAGSSPKNGLSWNLSGTGCAGSACGILSVITTQSTGGNSVADSANYTAPASAPQPSTVVVTVTAQADPSKKAQATILIQSGAGILILPFTATLAGNHRVTLSLTENGVSGALNWIVNGFAGGNTVVGQICVMGSSPCESVSSGTALQVDYIAPGAIPSPNPVSVVASSAISSQITASSQITVINHILVSVQPNNVTLPPLGVQGFTASILGTANQSVVWQVQGTGCAGGLCGTITPSGAYTAPSIPPTPNALQIVAVSEDDATQSGAASVAISTGANILTLHPASVYAGGANGFTIFVTGSGFVPTSPGPGSTLLIGGTSHLTTCNTANSCSAPANSTDVAQAGNVNVQIQNADGIKSNVVPLVVAARGNTEDVIVLSTADPTATGKDITVVEPTSAGLDTPDANLDLEVAAIGTYVTATNTCNLAGNPIPLVRPANGSVAADICLFSQAGFDTSMQYTISGPNDVAVIAKQPAGLGIIHLTLQIPASAAPGARTLFIQNANLDFTPASGVLEIR